MKTSQKLKNMDKEEQADFENRRKIMLNEIQHLSETHHIDLVAVLNYQNQGLIPNIVFVNVKKQWEESRKEKPEVIPTLEV